LPTALPVASRSATAPGGRRCMSPGCWRRVLQQPAARMECRAAARNPGATPHCSAQARIHPGYNCRSIVLAGHNFVVKKGSGESHMVRNLGAPKFAPFAAGFPTGQLSRSPRRRRSLSRARRSRSATRSRIHFPHRPLLTVILTEPSFLALPRGVLVPKEFCSGRRKMKDLARRVRSRGPAAMFRDSLRGDLHQLGVTPGQPVLGNADVVL